jgi:hypothetical protein
MDGLMIDQATNTSRNTADLWRALQDAVSEADRLLLAYQEQLAVVQVAGQRFKAAFQADLGNGPSH